METECKTGETELQLGAMCTQRNRLLPNMFPQHPVCFKLRFIKILV